MPSASQIGEAISFRLSWLFIKVEGIEWLIIVGYLCRAVGTGDRPQRALDFFTGSWFYIYGVRRLEAGACSLVLW
jgi:hypothetical protein